MKKQQNDERSFNFPSNDVNVYTLMATKAIEMTEMALWKKVTKTKNVICELLLKRRYLVNG